MMERERRQMQGLQKALEKQNRANTKLAKALSDLGYDPQKIIDGHDLETADVVAAAEANDDIDALADYAEAVETDEEKEAREAAIDAALAEAEKVLP